MKVTITGITASGKTTVALLIADALRSAGLTVVETDVDVLDGNAHPEHQAGKLKAIIAKGLTIEVATQQLRKVDRYSVSVCMENDERTVMPIYAGSPEEARGTAEQLLGATGHVVDVGESS
jgi:uridine kinase